MPFSDGYQQLIDEGDSMFYAVAIGLGPFPIEMLRRNQAWPMTEWDSNLLTHLENAEYVRVCLMNTTGNWLVADWSSFGWVLEPQPSWSDAMIQRGRPNKEFRGS